jgi:glutathione S-transferase
MTDNRKGSRMTVETPGKITITALKWVPPFAQGQVRDHRVRWVLNEAGWPYSVRLLDTAGQQSAAYRAEQPFGQVPVLEEEGRPPLFETGAIVLDVAMRSGKLLPRDDAARARAICWLFAAINSIEPLLSNVSLMDLFIEADDRVKAQVRPQLLRFAEDRLQQLATALGRADWLVGDSFTIADLMTSSVLKVVHHTDLLERFPALQAYRDRCFARPAYRKAIADQLAEIRSHDERDMKYELRKAG